MSSVRTQCVARILFKYGLAGPRSSRLSFACQGPQKMAVSRWDKSWQASFPTGPKQGLSRGDTREG